ncbi:MAG TPA: EamA family transporter, partial [Gemmatimonadales bacterium]|nr:EamA family transporter [Gemmatimonadales bacterium]
HASATVVGTYAYVNPVVAVLLGWMLLHEELSARKLVAMMIILGAVVWIQRSVSPARVQATAAAIKAAA